jgi:hypothetical protein
VRIKVRGDDQKELGQCHPWMAGVGQCGRDSRIDNVHVVPTMHRMHSAVSKVRGHVNRLACANILVHSLMVPVSGQQGRRRWYNIEEEEEQNDAAEDVSD